MLFQWGPIFFRRSIFRTKISQDNEAVEAQELSGLLSLEQFGDWRENKGICDWVWKEKDETVLWECLLQSLRLLQWDPDTFISEIDHSISALQRKKNLADWNLSFKDQFWLINSAASHIWIKSKDIFFWGSESLGGPSSSFLSFSFSPSPFPQPSQKKVSGAESSQLCKDKLSHHLCWC